MLCPVCNETPLRGRQQICSTKCRSASYRERKRQHHDTSQTGVPRLSNRRPRSSRREDSGRWEKLLTTATDRIVEAILKHGNASLCQSLRGCRVDLRTQVITQAPKHAIGYRLVLPGHCAGDWPKLSPKRSQERAAAWYSLTPFEYPDDLRLRNGSCYRVIWIDAAGLRIRLKAEESIPSLYFFLSPPSVPDKAAESDPPEVVSQDSDKLRVTSATSITEDYSVTSSQSQDGALHVVISSTETEAGPTPVDPVSPFAATEENHHSSGESVASHPEPQTARTEVCPQSVAALHPLLSAYPPLSSKPNRFLMDLANSDNAIRVAEPPPVTAISQQSTDSSCEGFPLYLPAPELVIESIEVVAAEAETDARSSSVPVQSAPNPRSLQDMIDDLNECNDFESLGAKLQSLIERFDQERSELDRRDAEIGEGKKELATEDWVPSEEWIADFKSKSIREALLSVVGVWELSPRLNAESDPESASDSYQRFRAQLHGEISALAREAESKLGDGTGSFLIAERTESFIKKHVLKALDRWDLLLGKTIEESLSTESTGWVSGIENQALARVHHALLSWLDGMGITAFQPLGEPFNAMLHHRHSQVHQTAIPTGHIIRVLRSGYLRDGKLLRRAQVIVAT